MYLMFNYRNEWEKKWTEEEWRGNWAQFLKQSVVYLLLFAVSTNDIKDIKDINDIKVFTQTKQQICLQFFFLSDKDKIFRSIWNFRQKLLTQRASQILSKYSLKTCNTAHMCGQVKLVFIPICKGNFHEDSVLWNWCTDF